MNMNRDEEKILEEYRSLLADEINSPEVQQDKSNFISTHFSADPVVLSGPFLVGLGVCVFGLAMLLNFGLVPKRELAPAQALKAKEQVQLSPVEAVDSRSQVTAVTPLEADEVTVKSVTSRVGPTMVYQKEINNVSITIVWVFPGKGM